MKSSNPITQFQKQLLKFTNQDYRPQSLHSNKSIKITKRTSINHRSNTVIPNKLPHVSLYRSKKRNKTEHSLMKEIRKIETRMEDLRMEQKENKKIAKKLIRCVLSKRNDLNMCQGDQKTFSLIENKNQKNSFVGRTFYKKKNLKRKFRILVFTVLFSLKLPKYAKKLTQLRFQYFKQNHQSEEQVNKKIVKLKSYLRSELIDYLESQNFIQLYQKHQKGQNKNNGKKGNFKIIFFFKFLVRFIIKILELMLHEEFYQTNEILIYFHNLQFPPDCLFEQSDFKLLKIHSQKSYSQHDITSYLTIKFIFMQILIKQNFFKDLLSQAYLMHKSQDLQILIGAHRQLLWKIVHLQITKMRKNIKFGKRPKIEKRPFGVGQRFCQKKFSEIESISELDIKKNLYKCSKMFAKVEGRIQKFVHQIWKNNFNLAKQQLCRVVPSPTNFDLHTQQEHQSFIKQLQERIVQFQSKIKKQQQNQSKDEFQNIVLSCSSLDTSNMSQISKKVKTMILKKGLKKGKRK